MALVAMILALKQQIFAILCPCSIARDILNRWSVIRDVICCVMFDLLHHLSASYEERRAKLGGGRAKGRSSSSC